MDFMQVMKEMYPGGARIDDVARAQELAFEEAGHREVEAFLANG